jgi:hypothetical protein
MTMFRTRVRLAAAVSGLALIGALAFSGAQALGATPARAAAGPATSHAVHPLVNYGFIQNDAATDKCLGTNGGRNNTYAVIWTCQSGAKNQNWTTGPISPVNDYYTMIKNENGDCLGLSGGQSSEGTAVVAWTCQPGSENQYWWHVYDRAVSQFVLCNLTQPCTNYSATGRVAGVAGGGIANGARVVLWDNNGAENQGWYCDSACPS